MFPLANGGAACLQLQDEGDLRRGGVYLLAQDDPERTATAPRFDELFADTSSKLAAHPDLAEPLAGLLLAARDAAKACRPRLTPEALAALGEVAQAAAVLDARAPTAAGTYTWEELLVSCMLIFVSEEERYPRPRYKGGDLALERLIEATGLPVPGSP